MQKFLANKEDLREAFGKYSSEGFNKRLKYAAWISIGIAMLMMVGQVVILFSDDDAHYQLFLWFRGFAGAFAIMFAVLYTILLNRVNRAYWQERLN